ncbi:MAG: pyridoxamine 5'-phosphate oxidase family protein [Candidatus Thorarchaeota archaeon]
MKKEYPHSMEYDWVWERLRRGGLAHFATMDEDQPRVRIVSLNPYDKQLWIATRTKDNKVLQLMKNGLVEFTIVVRGEKGVGGIRGTGKAIIVEDLDIKRDVAASIQWFSGYWDSHEDPHFTLIRLEMSKFLVDHPDDRLKYTVIVKS